MELLDNRIGFDSDLTIKKMLRDLHELIAKLNRVHVKTDYMESLYNNLNVLNLFSNRHIISIAGLQSAGKTYLVKRVLGLPDDLLLSEVGVGEKRPVLISANPELDELQFYCTKTIHNSTGSFDVVTAPITKEELNSGVQNPSSEMLWFEIVLPDDRQIGHLTLALLPGFERSKQSDSQKFLDIFLSCSTGMLLVLNHMRLAQMDQELLLKKVSNTYKDKSPGFILTYANELSEDKKQTIVMNLVDRFSIKETSQVVFSDTDIANVPAEVERLIKQNSQFTYDSLNLHHKKLLLIGQELFQEISKVEKIVEAQYDTDNDSKQLHTIQREFISHRDQYLEGFKKALTNTMEQHVSECARQVDEDLVNEKHNVWKKFKAAFKNDLTFKEKQEILQWIKEIYATDEPMKLDREVIEIIDQTTKSKASKYKLTKGTPEGLLRQSETVPTNQSLSFLSANCEASAMVSAPAVMPIKNSSKEQDESAFLNEEIARTLQVIKQYLDPNVADVTLSENEIRYMPIIAGSIAQQIIASRKVMDQYKISEGEMNNYSLLKEKMGSIDPLKEEINDLVLDMRHMVMGTAVFFGVDALDGEFNSFGAIISALQGLGLTVGAATGVAAAGVAGLSAGIAIKKGSEKIEKYKFDRQDYALNVLRAAGNYQIESVMEFMQEIMDDMEDKLLLAYQSRRQSKTNLSVYEEIDSRINRLKNECGKLRESAFRNAAFIK